MSKATILVVVILIVLAFTAEFAVSACDKPTATPLHEPSNTPTPSNTFTQTPECKNSFTQTPSAEPSATPEATHTPWPKTRTPNGHGSG